MSRATMWLRGATVAKQNCEFWKRQVRDEFQYVHAGEDSWCRVMEFIAHARAEALRWHQVYRKCTRRLGK